MVALQTPDEMQAQQYARDLALNQTNDTNVSNATNAYNQASSGANTAQNALSDFTKNMQSGTDVYAKALQAGNTNAGYDVNNLNQAQDQVSQITGIMGGLPRAIQASNANYGATAGNVANQYATTGANLNQSLQLANQNTQNQLAKQQAGLTGAQAGTSAQLTTQDQQRQGYAAAADNAAKIMQTTQTQMQQMIQLQQTGQQLTANDQLVFGQLKQAYAAAAQAYAVAQYNNAQTAQVNYSLGQQQKADAASAAAAQSAAASKSSATAASSMRFNGIADAQRIANDGVSSPEAKAAANQYIAKNNSISNANTGGAFGAFINPMANALGSAGHWLFG